MKEYKSYAKDVGLLVRDIAIGAITNAKFDRVEEVLNGQPAEKLRGLIPISKLRSDGIFFTGSRLASFALKTLQATINNDSIIFDPACGTGDLLLKCTSFINTRTNLNETLIKWSNQLYGCDIHSEFVDIARNRLILSAIDKHAFRSYTSLQDNTEYLGGLITQCGMNPPDILDEVTHIVVNPPFSLARAPSNCSWAAGTVNYAALFLEKYIRSARPGTRLIAILPDVLRSGARYEKWRKIINNNSLIERVQLYGRFDQWTDIDVFVIELTIRPNTTGSRKRNPGRWTPSVRENKPTIGDKFNIHIGPVVNHRDPHLGNWHPYARTHDLPPWSTVDEFKNKRRFLGKTYDPPFVAVRRTSRPDYKFRAVGTLVTGKRPVAVENHIIILSPKSGSIGDCKALLDVLKHPYTSSWLNKRIRCRHLTVASLKEIPWKGD